MSDKRHSDRIIQVKDIHIGSNIRKLRQISGLKQTDLVKKLQVEGIDISTYSYNRIEKGTQNPTVSLLLTLCKILNCDMNEIFSI